MERLALTESTNTLVNACQASLEFIVRQISMNALVIRALMVACALIWLTDSSANVQKAITMLAVWVMSMSVQQILALMDDAKTASINSFVIAMQVTVERDARLISMNAAQILANMVAYALIS
jgi:hypothetical protein